MEITWSHYYGITRKLASFTGMWPYLKPRTRLLRTALMTMTMLTIFVPQIAYQFMCNDLQCIFESVTSCMLTSVALVKVCTFQLNIHKIEGFTENLYLDWKQLEIPEEYKIIKSYAENCRRFSLIYPAYCCAAVCIFMSVSLIPHILDIILPLNETRPILLPYPGYYFMDNRKYFIYIFWHSIMAWEIIMVGIVAHDCMFVSYIEHVCSIFALVGFRFEYLFHNRNDVIKNVNTDLDDIYRKKLVFFVHTHRAALEFAQLLEDTFTIPFAIHLLIVIMTMSSTLLQIASEDSDTLEVLRYVLYVGGQLIHLFCFSFEGQKLIDHSFQIHDKIYTSSWYEAPIKIRKLLMLVMIQSVRPTSLSAGKIYVFSLESFTMVLQTSMSYFTVLASFQ